MYKSALTYGERFYMQYQKKPMNRSVLGVLKAWIIRSVVFFLTKKKLHSKIKNVDMIYN